MQECIEEFCIDSGLSVFDMGAQLGFILGHVRDKEDNEQLKMALSSINQTFFFSGINYAIKHKDKFEYVLKEKGVKPNLEENIIVPKDYVG